MKKFIINLFSTKYIYYFLSLIFILIGFRISLELVVLFPLSFLFSYLFFSIAGYFLAVIDFKFN